ncbi:hypothetical protein [Candidatus Nitrospira neomarina]|uniref:Uncharacterized protein n=1 Tax=Candidatus Nitrospira neomarina TaxID=3020899 RepID=A0AA96JWA2_9BACT|nr:hypothetical protein [Candidatus Nitrospira neomarina]WNM62278.1 hypothetical protein PQG83_00605 [Candidatus Nitrospira neomarina]
MKGDEPRYGARFLKQHESLCVAKCLWRVVIGGKEDTKPVLYMARES